MANVTMFLQPPAGKLQNLILKDMAVDTSSQPGFTIIDIDVGLKHPFPGLDMYTGFDVRGVFMHLGEYVSSYDTAITWPGPEAAMLLNPDGYTRWMNAVEFTTTGILGFTPGAAGSPGFVPTATLNPYKYFTDGLDASGDLNAFFSNPANLEKRGEFRPGNVNYRHYRLRWPMGPLTFQYAVVASYNEPTVSPPVNIPGDFPINANCAEPFNVAVSDDGSTAFYLSPDARGGDLHLKLEVFDWGVLGHGGTVTDEIGDITLESQGTIISTPKTFTASALTASPGTAVSSVYDIDIFEVLPEAITGQTILCRVTSAIQDSYDYGFGSAVPDGPLAAYMTFDAPIAGTPPEGAHAVASACDCLWIAPGESITFDGLQSSSTNGSIVKWEWDFNGDGTFGDTYTGSQQHPTRTFSSSGDYYVNLRVTDSMGSMDTLAPSEQLHVHVGAWTPPTAIAKIIPLIGFINYAGSFKGSGSTGPLIDLYEWDFEGDCVWDYQSETIGDTTHAYTSADIYNAVLRVTGNGCDTLGTQVRMIDPLPIIQNGNFWDTVTWAPWTHANGGVGTKTETIELNDTYKTMVHFYRYNSFNDGGICLAEQDMDYDVSGLQHLYLNFFFEVISASLTGDGWISGEMDMAARIYYDDGTSSPPNWKQVWLGYDLFTSDPGNQWQWDTTAPAYVTYHQQEKLPSAGVWYERKSPDLMAVLSPKPTSIKHVRFDTGGWDFNTYWALPWFSEE
jgi:PKD repeat protein